MIDNMNQFLSPPPVVRLEKAFPEPFKNMIATARTCYSSKGIVREEEITPHYERLAKSIYKAGHHTVLQHAYFQFTLSNVSRYFVWSFLHSHPYYNSEQVSQRYVAIKPGNFIIPPLNGEALNIYEKTIDLQIRAYNRLIELLYPHVKREYERRFRPYIRPEKKKEYELLQMELPLSKIVKSLERGVIKKAQEIARYVIPIGAFTYLYHTINALTLFRYYRLSNQFDVPHEQRIVIRKMIDEVLKIEPLYARILEEPVDIEMTPEYQFFMESNSDGIYKKTFIEEFDKSLEGRFSKLVGFKENNEALVAQGVREVLGMPSSKLNDKRAIKLALDPSKNRLLGETLNLTTISKLTRALNHATYTFRKKLSHTADSQDQRHRTVPASRPCLHRHFTEEPDYITPEIIRKDAKIEKFYRDIMEQIWENINKLKKLGVSHEFALYLLPNAVAVRFTESGDLLNLRHKYIMRLCYNAQEEIWRASLEEVEQIQKINPTIGKYLLPPCSLRFMAGTHPICPEGERFCGVKVWRLRLKNYRRII